ncbi:LOW QUALITY PROTEIN: stonustoxin subunit alpha-like [Mobula birostris]|uniref:LOW QUALITY PROTEIN: stonustoxin subunit alpha-like n=1 Tax=Mobula birostris TaxID=1983395 RepID=UPI003B289CE5
MCEVMELATLGRPFQLGMLYDCRSDTLIPDITLWDSQTLKNNLSSRDHPCAEFHIITSDSMEKKVAALSVSESLKASLLSGAVEVKGSAKYLTDTKESKRQTRVTLQYKTTTSFEQLTMSHLRKLNISDPSVFDKGSATHVVIAVLYGAQAFFVFDQMVPPAEKLQDVQRNMEATITHLPEFAVQGEDSLKMTEEQKFNSEKFSCTFYGDFSLKNNPTTFQDAITTYATLPSLLGSGGENSVPVRVTLYPLSKLNSKAAQVVREISVALISHCQRVLEQLSEADMVKDRVSIQFPEIGDGTKQFQGMCLEYKLVFQGTLARVLSSIRRGEEKKGLLVDILKNRELSPFSQQSLVTWLDNKEQELKAVGHYLRMFEDIPLVKSKRELDDKLMDPTIDYVVCFTFTSLHQDDLYLSEAKNYLQSLTAQKMQSPTPTGACATRHSKPWFCHWSASRKMEENSQLFLDFATANKADGKIKFLVTSVKDDSQTGSAIYLYREGSLENPCFEPPSQPRRPIVRQTTHDSVTLQLHPPRYGASEIVGYKVEYQGPQQEGWTSVVTPDKSQSFTISGLQPSKRYYFQYRAVSKVGVSKSSVNSRYKFTWSTGLPISFTICHSDLEHSKTEWRWC